jgi:hypothetical protein
MLRSTNVSQQLEQLEARVARMETSQTTEAQPPTEKRKEAAVPTNPDPHRVSEDELAGWLDEELRVGSYDPTRTLQLQEQLTQGLEGVEGVALESADCGSRVCRSTLSNPSGGEPDVLPVLALLSDFKEAFTVVNDDGQVSLFVPRNGVTLAELREEALAELRQ